MTNETTNPNLASECAKIVKMDDAAIVRMAAVRPNVIRSMAASLLTQVADKAKTEALIGSMKRTGATIATKPALWVGADVAPKIKRTRKPKPDAP